MAATGAKELSEGFRESGDGDGRRGLAASIVAHLLVVVLIIAKGLFFPARPLNYTPTLRVDLVGLPELLRREKIENSHAPPDDQLARELKRAEAEAKAAQRQPPPKPPPAAVSPAKAEAARPDEMVLHPKRAAPAVPPKAREKRLMSALDRIKALEQIQAEVSSSGTSPKAASVPLKGNRISKGSSVSDDAKESDQVSYFDSVRDKLQENWALPVWLQRQGYSAKVTLFIDSRGRVRNILFDQASGNQQFDDAVKQTIQQSQPFDPPPAGLASSALNNGIPFAFPL